MRQYHGYCPRCKQSEPVYLDTLIGRPPLNCKSCGAEIEVTSKEIPTPVKIPINTPQATVTQAGPHADDINRDGTLVYLSQGRQEAFHRLMLRAFPDGRIVGEEFL